MAPDDGWPSHTYALMGLFAYDVVVVSLLNACELPGNVKTDPDPGVKLEDERFMVYEDKREVIGTYVSTYGYKGNQIKANWVQVQIKYSNGESSILNTP